MLTSLALLILMRADWDLPPLTPVIFPTLTGRNGAEEYTEAMDVLRKGHFTPYSDWRRPEDRPAGGSSTSRSSWDKDTTSDQRYIDQINRLDGLNTLDFRKDELLRFGSALDLISLGNQKSAVFPDNLTFKLPPVGEVLFLSSLAADSAFVRLSDGQSGVATNNITESLAMSQRMAGINFMQTQVGALSQSLLLRAFAENMDRFSVADAQAFESEANEILRLPPPFLAAFQKDLGRGESEASKSILEMKAQKPDVHATKDELALFGLIQGASDDDMRQIAQQVVSEMQANGAIALKRFDGPESEWLPDTDTDPPDVSASFPKTIQDAAAYLAQVLTPPLAKRAASIKRDMQTRAQIRLLRIAARIVAFRLNWERLPTSLSEMKLPPDYVFDPLSKEPFVYELKGATFDLYSRGWKGQGQVDLFTQPASSRPTVAHP